MDSFKTPTECHPDLLPERLEALAQFFAETRRRVIELHQPFMGDDAWSLGCRSFARCRNLLVTKSQTGDWPWFRVLNPGKKFIFAIGEVPVRFYKGSHRKPPHRTLAYCPQELSQLSLAFPDANVYRDLKWRFAIETDYLGDPVAVIFAGLASDDGAVVCHWKIPFEITERDLLELPAFDMVELSAPLVGVNVTIRNNDSAANE